MARIVSAVALGSPHLEQFAGWDLAVVDFATASTADLSDALRDAEGLLVNSHVSVDAATLDLAPSLRAISTVSVGFDHIDLEVAGRRSITVTTTPVLSDAVADLTLALITMVLRRLGEAASDLGRGVWSNSLLGSDVRGKQLLLVGFGRIGREVAARALAAKMRVCAFDLRADLPPMAGVERVASFAEGVSRADVVSLHVDLNPSTRHFLDDGRVRAHETDRDRDQHRARRCCRSSGVDARARRRAHRRRGSRRARGRATGSCGTVAPHAERRRVATHRVGDDRDPLGDARLRGDQSGRVHARRRLRARAHDRVALRPSADDRDGAGGDAIAARVAHLDDHDGAVGPFTHHRGGGTHRADTRRREEVQGDVAGLHQRARGCGDRAFSGHVDERRRHPSVHDPPWVSHRIGDVELHGTGGGAGDIADAEPLDEWEAAGPTAAEPSCARAGTIAAARLPVSARPTSGSRRQEPRRRPRSR